MKYIYSLCFILLVLLPVAGKGQNMVPNGDFEQYVSCPSGVSQMQSCSGWRQYHQGTSDYFNVCNNGTVGVPVNIVGTQLSASGNGYAGFYTYNGVTDYKEYVARPIQPLTPGVIYEVSLSVNLADRSGYTTNDLGVWFYHNGPAATISGNTYLQVTPQVSFTSYGAITDTANWVRVKAIFTPDSAYDNIVIGGFGSSVTTSPSPIGAVLTPYAYYLIDSVVIKKGNMDFTLQDTAYCAGDILKLPFTGYPGRYSMSNIFSLQLSDASGSFATASTIDTRIGNAGGTFQWTVPANITPSAGYRLRIMSTDVVDSSYESRNISIGNAIPGKPTIAGTPKVCEGDSIKLTSVSTTANVSYTWAGPSAFFAKTQNTSRYPALPAHTGRYVVSTWLLGCVARDSFNVVVVPTLNVVHASAQNVLCANDTLKLYGSSTAAGATNFTWIGPHGFTSTAKDTIVIRPSLSDAGNYIVTGHYSGCSSSHSVPVTVLPIPQSFSAGSSKPICEGDTLLFSAFTTTPGVSYEWTGSKSFSSTISNPHIGPVSVKNSGKYSIRVALGSCAVVDTLTVNVTPVTNVISALSNGTMLCPGDTLKLSGHSTATAATQYAWIGPDSFSAAATDPTLIISGASQGRYIVKGFFGGCAASDTLDITVKPSPANVTATYSGAVCQGGSVDIEGTASGTALSYNWKGPGNFASSLQQVSLTNMQPAESGNYIFTATMDGCRASDTVNVLIKPDPPTPQISINDPVLKGGDLLFSIRNSANNISYSWIGPAGFHSALQDPVLKHISWNNAGIYIVTATQDGCTSADSIEVHIAATDDSIMVYPNANNGNFTIRGLLARDQHVSLNITSSNGQVVYEAEAETQYSLLNVNVSLPDAISSGVYTLRLLTDGKLHAIRIVVAKTR